MASDLRIALPAELFAPAESSHFEGVATIDSLQAGPDELRFDEPLPFSVDVTNTGDAMLVEGTVTGVATIACARCLEDATYTLEGEIDGYFLLNEPEYIDEDDEDFDVLSSDHVIDLEPLISSALIVEAPLVPLCRDDCKGLCPQCGANLNEGPCGCAGDAALEEFERAANPFSALSQLVFDEDDGE